MVTFFLAVKMQYKLFFAINLKISKLKYFTPTALLIKIQISLAICGVTFQKNLKLTNNRTTTLRINWSETMIFLSYLQFPLFSDPPIVKTANNGVANH